jgi:predicted Ser/Thr protein kinase
VTFFKKAKKKEASLEMSVVETMHTIKEVTVKEKLGSGNFGEVYKGEWKVKKILPKGWLMNLGYYGGFEKTQVFFRRTV